MRQRKKKKPIKLVFCLMLIGIAFLALVSSCLPKDSKVQKAAVLISAQEAEPRAALESPPPVAPTPTPSPYTPDEREVEMLAQMLWGEARGIPSDMEKAACVWCVLNRVDDGQGLWPDTIEGVLTQKSQFVGYSAKHPTTDELKTLAADVLIRWQQEKTEGGDAGRVLPANYFFFTGDGQRNHFRTEYEAKTLWDWSLPNPYEN